MRRPWRGSLLLLAVAAALLLSACSSPPATNGRYTNRFGDTIEVRPAGLLPSFLAQSPTWVAETYRWAVANPEKLKGVMCDCGCIRMGHADNRFCYFEKVNADGSVLWNAHGAG